MLDIFKPSSSTLFTLFLRLGDPRDTTFSVSFSSESGLRQRCIRLRWRGIRPGSGSADSFAVGFSNCFVFGILRILFTGTLVGFRFEGWADLMFCTFSWLLHVVGGAVGCGWIEVSVVGYANLQLRKIVVYCLDAGVSD